MQDDTIYSPHTEPDSENKDENSTKSKEVEHEWGKHPNSQKALKKHQYPKGMSGNVLGSKKKFEALGNNLKKLAEQETLNWNNKSLGTRKNQVLERIWKDAIGGDLKKIQLLAWLGCLD